MFNRLLVVTDQSSSALAVVGSLGGLKDLGARECLLLEILSANEGNTMMLDYVKSVAEENLQRQSELAEQQGLAVESRWQFGMSGSALNRVAHDGDYSLIVAGAFKHTLLGEMLLGELAYDLIHYAQKPVLMIRLQEKSGEGMIRTIPTDGNFRSHILFPTDFSDNAVQAFDTLKELVKVGVKHVTLMHVQDQYRIDPYLIDRLEEFNQIDSERLNRMQAELLELGCAQVDIQLSYGSPAGEIIDMVAKKAISLVIMGSQGLGYVRELFVGSVSNSVARHAATSVMLIPSKR